MLLAVYACVYLNTLNPKYLQDFKIPVYYYQTDSFSYNSG